MGIPKILVVAVAFVALAGFGVAAVAPEAIIGQNEEPLSFTVPLSRVGDRVVYEVYTESTPHRDEHGGHGGGHDETNAGVRVAKSGHGSGYDLVRSHAYTLAQLDVRLDWTGTERDVVVVSETRAHIDPATQTQTTPRAGPVDYVDRTERTSVGIDFDWSDANDGDSGYKVSLMRPGPAPLPYLELQGVTIETDMPFTLAPGFTPSSYGFGGGAGGIGGNDLPDVLGLGDPGHRHMSFRLHNDAHAIQREPPRDVTFTQRATIDETDVLGFVLADEGIIEPGHDPEHLHPAWDHGTPASWRNQETVWFSEDSPYPLLIEKKGEIRDADGNAFWWTNGTRWLEHYTQGPGGAAWGPSHGRDPHVPERGGEGHYPAEGTGSSIPYPLSAAIEDAALLTAPQWLLWQQQHPDARLVAATMTPGSHSTPELPSMEWRLSFADPAGNAIQLLTERSGEATAPYIEVMSEFQTHPYDEADLPSTLVTLGQVERYWRTYDADAPVTFVHWGFQDVTRESSATCMVGAASGTGAGLSPQEQLRRVQVGHTNLGPCFSADDVGLLSGIVVDVDRGHALGSFVFSHRWDDNGDLASAGTGPGMPIMHASASQGLPPTVVLSSLASSSLLLIIITIYLLPHIKWFGTQALLVVPGFSKLKKDKLLDHKLREQLNETIKANPGISPSELQRQTGAGWGTIVHHLTIMEKNDLVTSAIDGRHRRYFPHLAGGEAAARREAVLGNDNTQRVLSLVTAEPGIPTSAIATELGMSTAGAMWHLGRLTEAGFVDRRKEGRSVRYFPDQVPMSAVRAYDPNEAVEVV